MHGPGPVYIQQACPLSDGPRRWAWNNSHITKRIANEQRISIPTKRSPKRGRTRKIVRPRTSLKDKLSNLHLLLRVPSFSRWPLQVRFFCKDVYRAWQIGDETAAGGIRGGIKVLLDLKQLGEISVDSENPTNMSTQAKGRRKREALGKGGVEGLNIGYSEMKSQLEKSIAFLAEKVALKCGVCAHDLRPKTAMALVCPQENCKVASHVTCLATKFIEDERAGAAVAPISGRCPGCKVELQWIDLIKNLSLRARGEKEVAQVMKTPRERKTKDSKTKNPVISQFEAHNFKEDVDDPDEYFEELDMGTLDGSDESLPDDWQYHDDDDDDMMPVMSGHSALSTGVEAASPTKRSSTTTKLPAVIEDSELDEAEFSD